MNLRIDVENKIGVAVRIGSSKSIQVTTRIISSKKEVDLGISTRKMRRKVGK